MQNTMSFAHSFDEAIDFVKKVRMEFADDREKYTEFLTILNDYARSVTDLRGTIARMEELLKGHKHLIITFRTFLPKEPQITLDGNDDDKAGEAKIEHLERKLLDINLRSRI
ncbi:paired amphipathic helix protein Sin3-like 2 [Trifolium pratense]|uniref:paired amphipathic helix protein Sin3-like 2 n=1 Tax=Trifolium pratense TaxID=57577 RepID=UPI001E692B65|nr:paired amphipathic helix protein Sin3-like 2 [Trifolium pratense]